MTHISKSAPIDRTPRVRQGSLYDAPRYTADGNDVVSTVELEVRDADTVPIPVRRDVGHTALAENLPKIRRAPRAAEQSAPTEQPKRDYTNTSLGKQANQNHVSWIKPL